MVQGLCTRFLSQSHCLFSLNHIVRSLSITLSVPFQSHCPFPLNHIVRSHTVPSQHIPQSSFAEVTLNLFLSIVARFLQTHVQGLCSHKLLGHVWNSNTQFSALFYTQISSLVHTHSHTHVLCSCLTILGSILKSNKLPCTHTHTHVLRSCRSGSCCVHTSKPPQEVSCERWH
jgi:uncharacterized membrane protein